MHESLFAESACPKPAIVFNLPLLPFSIGHELLLWHRSNALVTYTAASFSELSPVDQSKALAQAVLRCCRKAPFFTNRWAKAIARLDIAAEIEKFREYREAGSRDLPTVKMPRTHGAPFHYFGSPELARLINYVTTHHQTLITRHFDGSPLNFPLGFARQLYSTHCECEGALWIQNYHDWEDEQRKAAYEKAHPESGLAVGDDAVQAMAEKWNAEHPEAPVPLMRNPKPNGNNHA